MRVVVDWLDRLRAGTAPADLALDIVEAAEARAERDAPVAAALQRFRESLDPNDVLAPFRLSLEGGDRDKGRKVFFEHPVGQCIRCHAIDYIGGKAGPRLDQIGARANREHLLESLVEPNAKIAEGFATEVLTLEDDSVRVGVLAGETEDTIELVDAAGSPTEIAKSRVKQRETRDESAMPAFGRVLAPRDLRDLIEFLANQK